MPTVAQADAGIELARLCSTLTEVCRRRAAQVKDSTRILTLIACGHRCPAVSKLPYAHCEV